MAEVAKGLKRFVGKVITKNVKFMGETVEIRKLTLDQVLGIQALAKEQSVKANTPDSDIDQFEMVKYIIREGVVGGEELDDDDFLSLPLDEVTKLSEELMKYAGVDGESQAGKS